MQHQINYAVNEYSPEGFQQREISAIREIPLTIYLNGKEIVTLLCTGKYPEYLTLGFLKSDALVRHPDEINDLSIDTEEERLVAHVETTTDPMAARPIERTITSGCGKGTNFERNLATISRRRMNGSCKITPESILALADELHERSTLWCSTGGCHNSSLCNADGMLLFREDIGRHNAIDMIVGECFMKGIDTSDKIIVTTGRVASEILMKTVRIGVPMLVSTAAATSFSVGLAQKTALTLIGKVRGKSFWVYNDPGRIVGMES